MLGWMEGGWSGGGVFKRKGGRGDKGDVGADGGM